jgi:conjugal transfer/entry exclusion protein
MKKFIALALVTVGISVSARAQWIVYDPENTVQSIVNTAREIAKFVEVVNNQVQQIQTLNDQLNEFNITRACSAIPRRSCSSVGHPR